MKIENVYRPEAVTTAPTDTLVDAARTMRDAETGSLVVLEDDELFGIFTERDLLRAVADDVDVRATDVQAYTTRSVVTAKFGEDTEEVARRMLAAGVRRLPVYNANGFLAGVVSMRDLLSLETWA